MQSIQNATLNFEQKITQVTYLGFTKKFKYFSRIFQGHFEKTWILYQ